MTFANSKGQRPNTNKKHQMKEECTKQLNKKHFDEH